MAYFTQFLRPNVSAAPKDPLIAFEKSWHSVQATLEHPDERQLARGIQFTHVVDHLQLMVAALIEEAVSSEDATTGPCLEYILKNDVLGSLVSLSESDRPFGIQSEVLSTIIRLVSALDEHFLVHSAVHKAVIRLLRICVGDETQENVDDGARLLGAAGVSVHADPSEYELELVDLLCTLCTRIRTYPELLLIFLHDKNWSITPTRIIHDDEDEDDETLRSETPQGQESARAPSPSPSAASTITSAPSAALPRKPEYEFLIFNYLLRFAHREGKIGDLARGGIISLIDVAMTAGEILGKTPQLNSSTSSTNGGLDPVGEASLAMAEYVLEGDFSDVLCAGLGAVYSELPTKLEVRREEDEDQGATMILGGLSDEARLQKAKEDAERAEAAGVVLSTDPMFKARLDHFLKLLEFVQDILLRISSSSSSADALAPAAIALVGSAITQSIMETFRLSFLKNILYPSILECSDTDGSSVAVMVYLDEMLRCLSEASLSDLILTFLMSEEDDEEDGRPAVKYRAERVLDGRKPRRSKKSKRKSTAMLILDSITPSDPHYFSSLGRFTLKDLLIGNLRSPVQASASAALRLLGELFRDHCHLTVDNLVRVVRDENATGFVPNNLRAIADTPSSTVLSVSADEGGEEEEFVYPGMPPTPKASHFHPSSSTNITLSVEPETTYEDHDKEVNMYLALVNRIVPSDRRPSISLAPTAVGAGVGDHEHESAVLSTGFAHYLTDAITTIQSESCFVADSTSVLSMPRHRLVPNDPLLGALLQSLRCFFANSPEVNVELTGVLAAICACPHRSAKGWLGMGDVEDEELDWGEANESSLNGLDVSFDRSRDDDDDDRSIDYEVDDLLRSGSKVPPSSSLHKKRKKRDKTHLPVLFVIMSGLVDQLDRYRRSVDDFDRYLEERRQGLLFTENISDALNLHFELSADAAASGRGLLAAPAVPQNTPAKPATTTARGPFATAMNALFTPSKKASTSPVKKQTTPPKPKPAKTAIAAADLPRTPVRNVRDASTMPTTPFSPHYVQTSAIDVEAYVAPPPSVGPWSPAGGLKSSTATGGFSIDASFSSSFADDDSDVFSAPRAERDVFSSTPSKQTLEEELNAAARVSLSHLLDNVVILEESIKELAAILQVRRSIGIDTLRFF